MPEFLSVSPEADSVKIKICGLTRPEDMQICNSLGVTWAGFVFYPPSPRFITLEQAVLLDHAVPSSAEGGMPRVGLFVKPELAEIERILSLVNLDIIQLYGDWETSLTLAGQMNRPCWLARGVRQKANLPDKRVEQGFSGYIIEAPAEDHDSRPGGLGRRFDWALTRDWHAPAPWLLAGGLTPDNVQQAIKESGAKAVDVSSGVEDRPGVKSARMIETFVKKARQPTCTLPHI